MISIEIPEIRPMSDLEKFVVGLKQLATICNVTSISGLEVHFGDGSYGGINNLPIFRKQLPVQEVSIRGSLLVILSNESQNCPGESLMDIGTWL